MQAMADQGLAATAKFGGDGLSSEEEEEADQKQRDVIAKGPVPKKKRQKKPVVADSSDEEDVEFEDDLDDIDGELHSEEEGEGEGEAPAPLRADGKPMTEIDLFIYHATEEKKRQQRIARAKEAELAMERAAEASEFGTRSGQIRTMQLLFERKNANEMTVTSIFGILMMMTQLQVSWNGSTVEDNNLSEGIKFIILASTIYLEYQLYNYYRGYLDNLSKIYNFPQLNLSDSPYYSYYVLEAVVCSFHTPPFFNRIGLLSDRFSLFMFLRFYLVFRLWRDGNPVYVKHEAYSKHDVNKIYQFDMDYLYFIRFRFWENPISVVLQIFIVCFFIAVYCFYVVERELVFFVYDFTTSMWFMSVTMTTVGYNAFTPTDVLGRSFAMMGAVMAMITLAMMSAILARFIELQFREQVALGWSWRMEVKKQRDIQAAVVIQKFYRMFAVGRSLWVMRRKLHPRAAHQFFAALDEFRQTRIRYDESMVQGEGGYSLVKERIEKAEKDVDEHFNEVEDRIDETSQMLMENMVAQLTKLEEQQAMVLNANFESVLKYMRTAEKKLKQIANKDN